MTCLLGSNDSGPWTRERGIGSCRESFVFGDG